MTTGPYRVCSRCVMDTTAADIEFDERGRCSYCTDFLRIASVVVEKDPSRRAADRDRLLARVKASGQGKRYDCIVGVSGGMDSSWALVQAVKLGLRPLAVHMDNGWNTELAQNNIANIVRTLGVDLHTHVIDWDEYRALMQAFFDADVIDVELLYDNAMLAVNYRLAAEHGIRFILAGTNQATEGMRMPVEWNWFKYDKKNIKHLARRFGGAQLRTFPAIGTLQFIYYEFVRHIRWVSFLDYFDYNKQAALEVLQRDYAYKPYPYKHFESVFTRFYQGFILPKKFGVDKRRLHLSSLVMSGQMNRAAAMADLEGPPYPSASALDADVRYFLKKMGWNADQLQSYISRPSRPHSEFGTEKPLWDFCLGMYRRLALTRAKG